MPGRDGLSVLQAIREEGLPTATILLTAALDDDQLVDAVRLGVRGVVLKESAPRMIINAIREVRAGGSYMEGKAVSRALRKLVRRDDADRDAEKQLTRGSSRSFDWRPAARVIATSPSACSHGSGSRSAGGRSS